MKERDSMIITFCGHSQFQATERVERELLLLLEQKVGDASAELYFGGDGAFDAFALACGQSYKAKHPGTRLVFITPYITESYQKTHLEVGGRLYDEILYPSLEKVPYKFAIFHRNRRMVDRAALVIAYVEYSRGGAYQTFQYAKRKGKEVINLAEPKE